MTASAVPLLEVNNDLESQSCVSFTTPSCEERYRKRCTLIETGWSHIYFLTGSILYVAISIGDLRTSDENDIDDTVINENQSLLVHMNWSGYGALTFAAPLMYVLNAMSEFRNDFVERLHWDLAVTTIFGMAAVMDMVGAIVTNSGSFRLDNVPSTLAVHFYLLQAILALFGSSSRYENQISHTFHRFGNILFLIGCLIDVSVSYMNALEESFVWTVEVWDLVSSSLWLVDAILFITADLLDQ